MRAGRAVGTGQINFEADGFVVGFLEFALAGAEGAEEEIAGIGHDSGAAGSDTVFGKKKEKVGEEFIEVISALELCDFSGENCAQVGGMQEFGLFRRVAETEAGARVDDAEAAALAGDGAMLATGGVVDDAGFSRRLVHDDLNFGGRQ